MQIRFGIWGLLGCIALVFGADVHAQQKCKGVTPIAALQECLKGEGKPGETVPRVQTGVPNIGGNLYEDPLDNVDTDGSNPSVDRYTWQDGAADRGQFVSPGVGGDNMFFVDPNGALHRFKLVPQSGWQGEPVGGGQGEWAAPTLGQ